MRTSSDYLLNLFAYSHNIFSFFRKALLCCAFRNILNFKISKTSRIAILKHFMIFKTLFKSNFNGFHEKIRTTLDFTVFGIQSGFSFDRLNILTYCCFQIFSLQSHVFSALLRIFSGFNGFFRFFSFFYVLLSNYKYREG